MTLAPRTPGVVALGRTFLRTLAGEDRAVEIQSEAFGRLLEQREQPAEERTKERLHIALGEAREEAQDGIVARETLEAEQRVQSRVKAQPIAVSEARSPHHDAKQKRRERMRDGDRIGRRIAEGQRTSSLVEKANLAQPSDEAGQPSEGSDRLGGGGQKQVTSTGKGCKINGIVLCGGRRMRSVHKLPLHRLRRAKRPSSIAEFGFITTRPTPRR